jgi:hypothetical protein
MFKSIAISKDMGTVYLGTLFSRKSYGIQDVRDGSVWHEQRPGMGATYILKLSVADVGHADWDVPFYRARKPNRWVEILSQAQGGRNRPQLGGQPFQSHSSAAPQFSPDGKWWWTGSEWVPAASRK